MTQTAKTWTILGLVLAILLLILYLNRKKAATPTTTTNTSVNIGGTTSQFPTRNQNNAQLLRICTYDSGEQLSLDPGAVGGRCPVVYTDIAGKTGNLVKDEIITLPNAGNFTGDAGA
jgi:hypothetical protein